MTVFSNMSSSINDYIFKISDETFIHAIIGEILLEDSNIASK